MSYFSVDPLKQLISPCNRELLRLVRRSGEAAEGFCFHVRQTGAHLVQCELTAAISSLGCALLCHLEGVWLAVRLPLSALVASVCALRSGNMGEALHCVALACSGVAILLISIPFLGFGPSFFYANCVRQPPRRQPAAVSPAIAAVNLAIQQATEERRAASQWEIEIRELPNELLQHILGYLVSTPQNYGKLQSVCKLFSQVLQGIPIYLAQTDDLRWSNVLSPDRQWRIIIGLSARPWNFIPVDGESIQLTAVAPSTPSLGIDLSHYTIGSDAQALQLLNYLKPNVRVFPLLSLSLRTVTSEALTQLAPHLPTTLERLVFSWLPAAQLQDFIQQLPDQVAQQIKYIDITANSYQDLEDSLAILGRLSEVTQFHIIQSNQFDQSFDWTKELPSWPQSLREVHVIALLSRNAINKLLKSLPQQIEELCLCLQDFVEAPSDGEGSLEETLERFAGLRSLHLEGRVPEEALERFGVTLARFTHLEEFTFPQSARSQSQCAALLRSLPSGLRSLKLPCLLDLSQPLEEWPLGIVPNEELAQALYDLLDNLESLQSFRMDRWPVTLEQWKAILERLPSTLTSLDVSWTHIDEEKASVLAHHLSRFAWLKELRLEYCGMRDRELHQLVPHLPASLCSLRLVNRFDRFPSTWNCFGRDAIISLLRQASRLACLHHLAFYRNFQGSCLDWPELYEGLTAEEQEELCYRLNQITISDQR